MRNAVEHFDEWIDHLTLDSFTGNVVDRSIIERDRIKSDAPVRFMRWIDPETGTAHVGDVEAIIYQVVDDLVRVGNAVQKWGLRLDPSGVVTLER